MSRRPEPTALKLVKGNPGKRAINKNEPAFKNCIPKCPMKLDKVGQKEWNDLSKLLFDAGVLTEVDSRALAVYCRIWSQIVLLSGSLNTIADYITDGDTNPLTVRLEKLYIEHRSYSAILGLDPANRSKIKVNTPPKPAEKEGKGRFFG